MSHLIQFQTDSGATIYVESASDAGIEGELQASATGILYERAARTLNDSLQHIRPFAETLMEQLADLPIKPAEMAVEFAIKLSTQAGVVVAQASAEGQITVKLVWKNASGA
jgi:hypothetical protein